MPNLVLSPGEEIKITLEDTDGFFIIKYGEEALTVESDFPDSTGRVGIIYEEKYGKGSDHEIDLPDSKVEDDDYLS